LEELFLEAVLLFEEVLASGTEILFDASGVGVVVHCHKPSALTQA
jgi:hypothetical protein